MPIFRDLDGNFYDIPKAVLHKYRVEGELPEGAKQQGAEVEAAQPSRPAPAYFWDAPAVPQAPAYFWDPRATPRPSAYFWDPRVQHAPPPAAYFWDSPRPAAYFWDTKPGAAEVARPPAQDVRIDATTQAQAAAPVEQAKPVVAKTSKKARAAKPKSK